MGPAWNSQDLFGQIFIIQNNLNKAGPFELFRLTTQTKQRVCKCMQKEEKSRNSMQKCLTLFHIIHKSLKLEKV